MKTRLAATVALLALLSTACAGSTVRSTFSTAFEAVEVNGGTGLVAVSGTDGEPFVEADSSGDLTLTTEVRDGVLVVEHDCPECSVDMVIEIPMDVDLTVTNSDGIVTVADITGAVTIDNGKGNITLRSLAGPLQVAVDDGNVLGLRLTGSPTGVTARLGSIDLSFDEAVGELDVSVTDGDVTVQAPGGPYNVDASTGDGDVEVQVDVDASAAARMTLRTEKGDVTIYDD